MEGLTTLGLNLGIKYLNLDRNVQLLETDLLVLTCRASDIEDEVIKAERSGRKKRKREVGNWLEDAKNLRDEFIALKARVKEEAFWTDPLRGDHVAKMQERVAVLLQQTQHFNGLLLGTCEKRGEPRVVTKLFGGMFKQSLEKIWQCLVSDNVSIIGIYGMGGVGKTTLAKHIHNKLLERSDFCVYWVTASQDLSLKESQNKIARIVGLDLSDEDDEEIRAAMLYKELMKLKNLVLVFDDVWEAFSLRMVGIPLGVNMCRLILTTRSLEVCRKLCCQRVFEAKTLEADEAWELFKYVLGDQTVLPAAVNEIAKSVTKRCAGLPLGIITVAGSMRGVTDIREWRNAFEQLKTLSVGYDDMEFKVFPMLEWSFSRLNKCHQRCFLHCSLYPEDLQIDRQELVRGFISAGLIDKRKTRKHEFDQGHAILNKLVNVCLLEKDEETDLWVKMHDLVRDMALRITSGRSNLLISKDMPRFMVKARVGLRQVPEEEEWGEDLDTVSLMWNKGISEIFPNTSPKCPNLSTLILRCTSLRTIPNLFFVGMSGLKVLDLCYTEIKELPNSVSDMDKLTALLLHGCAELESVPPLGKLKELRQLDLSWTSIEEVPQGLEILRNLKYLDMFHTRIKKIPEGTLSRLFHLQLLRVSNSIQAQDLQALKQLEIFHGGVSSMNVYNQLLRYYQSHGSYAILINEDPDVLQFSDYQFFYPYNDITDTAIKRLHFEKCKFGIEVLLPQDIEEVELCGCSGTSSCMSDVFPQLNCLVRCLISYSFEQELEFLLRLSTNLEEQVESAPLYRLETLSLQGLQNFIGLIKWPEPAVGHGRLPLGTFSQLKSLEIIKCDKIKAIFTLALLGNLKNLEELYVDSCEELEEIINETEGISISSTTLLPKLEILQLNSLPELKSIYDGTMICDSIGQISVVNCPKLKRLPPSLSTVRSLYQINGSEEWWESLEWDNPFTKNALQPKFLIR